MRKLPIAALIAWILALIPMQKSWGQSLEFMTGTEGLFLDAQWLRPLDKSAKTTLFSRSRASADYHQNTNLFMGAYLNYTTKTGLGGTILGRISSLESGADAGIHFFKASKKMMLYALASLALDSELGYSWFSIFRYTPMLGEKWKLYTSLELFTNFRENKHFASVQRIRLGLDMNGNQFGLAINLLGVGENYDPTESNPGVFIRKQF